MLTMPMIRRHVAAMQTQPTKIRDRSEALPINAQRCRLTEGEAEEVDTNGVADAPAVEQLRLLVLRERLHRQAATQVNDKPRSELGKDKNGELRALEVQVRTRCFAV